MLFQGGDDVLAFVAAGHLEHTLREVVMDTDSVGLVVLILAVVAAVSATVAICAIIDISANVNKLGSSID